MRKRGIGFLFVMLFVMLVFICTLSIDGLQYDQLENKVIFNELYQICELPESYIKILQSTEFIILMVICFLFLSVPFIFIIQSIIEKREKIKVKKFPWMKQENETLDTRINSITTLQMDSLNIIVIGLSFLLFGYITTVCLYLILIFFMNSFFTLGNEAGLETINNLGIIIPLVNELIAGLMIGISLISISKKFSKKKKHLTLGIFWLIWLLFSPGLDLANVILLNSLSAIEDYDSFLGLVYFYNNSPITNAIQIFHVIKIISTSVILFFTAKELVSLQILQTKGLLISFSILTWLISTLKLILVQVNLTIPSTYWHYYDTLNWALAAFLVSLIYANMIIIPILAIITLVMMIVEFRKSIKHKRSSFLKTQHDISTIKHLFITKTQFNQKLKANENLTIYIEESNKEIDEIALSTFENRLDEQLFLVFMDSEKNTVPSFFLDFLKISDSISELDVYYYPTIQAKPIPFLSTIKWRSQFDFEQLLEFNITQLPCIYILDKYGNELGKAEGKLKHEQTLIEELIFNLDVGAFI